MAIHTSEMPATDTVPDGAETAVTIPNAAAPVTAPDSPGTTVPDAEPAPDGDARVAAVWAALNAEPGGSATVIGAAAGLSRMVAGKILKQFEAEGRARREPGTNDGQTRGRAADRWYPITAATTEPTGTADVSSPAPAPESPDVAPPAAITAPDAGTPHAEAIPASDEEVLPAAIVSADPAPAQEPTGEANAAEEPGGQPEDLSVDDTAGQGAEDQLGGAPDADTDADASEPVADDPAWVRARADLTELIELFGGVISAKDQGGAVMALGCLEMAMTKVTSAHRNARAVLTGTSTASAPPASRPGTASGAGAGDGVRSGALRDMVHAHLLEFPDKDFTPYEIGRVLDRSSGAVANALDRLVSLGDAVLCCERPRRFALAPNATPATVAAVPADADAGNAVEADTYGD
ncbi:hypothetical protein FAF44_52190 [Nonomuraea sp. MG754425]|uniref:hypothetical protein n=1 Tax=Nonomuraea sp. MG754425 TaxID=2570319 RepID=UPI001F39AC66|nr:hypothetical protein [Nonomuraea sp. MG754425]MCF6476827.1 hypothetical protein [Nonomuraea sp. MG754425]